MKKTIPSLMFVLVLITGCGGGGTEPTKKSSSSDTSEGRTTGKYKLWDYVAPKTDTTNNFIEIKGEETKKYKTFYAISSNSVTETSDYVPNEKTIYTKKEDRIRVSFMKDDTQNGFYDLHLTADIGQTVTVLDSTCKLEKHYDNIKINDKDFSDVIEIKCKDKPGYYQKGIGEIAQTQISGSNGTRSVRMLSN